MQVIEHDRSSANVRLTERELRILANALNETKAAIEAWEFSTRVGAEVVEVEELRQKLGTLIDAMGK